MSNRLKLLREKATRPRRTVPVLLDGEVREQIEAVEDELDRLDSGDGSDKRLNTKSATAAREKLLAELDKLYEAAQDSTLFVVLEGMQRTPYRALVNAHPPRTDADGKILPADRLAGNVNAETFILPLIRACIVGYRERPEADAPVLPFPPDMVGYEPNSDAVTVGWLLGFTYKHPESEEPLVVEGFATPRQISTLGLVASELSVGDDAVPLRRKRSATPTPDAG